MPLMPALIYVSPEELRKSNLPLTLMNLTILKPWKQLAEAHKLYKINCFGF